MSKGLRMSGSDSKQYRDACDFNGDELPVDGQNHIGVTDSYLEQMPPCGIAPDDPRIPRIKEVIARITGEGS